MNPRRLLVILITGGKARLEIYSEFKKFGFSAKYVDYLFDSNGLFIGEPMFYSDLNPSPDRRTALVELSIGE